MKMLSVFYEQRRRHASWQQGHAEQQLPVSNTGSWEWRRCSSSDVLRVYSDEYVSKFILQNERYSATKIAVSSLKCFLQRFLERAVGTDLYLSNNIISLFSSPVAWEGLREDPLILWLNNHEFRESMMMSSSSLFIHDEVMSWKSEEEKRETVSVWASL